MNFLYFFTCNPKRNMMVLCPEHPTSDQNPKFTPLSEAKSIPTPLICGIPPPGVDVRIIVTSPQNTCQGKHANMLLPCVSTSIMIACEKGMQPLQ